MQSLDKICQQMRKTAEVVAESHLLYISGRNSPLVESLEMITNNYEHDHWHYAKRCTYKHCSGVFRRKQFCLFIMHVNMNACC